MRPSFRLKRFSGNRTAETGLTLIELLVSLVILGFVVTIMSGVFSQISKIVNIAESVNSGFQQKWLAINPFKEMIANMTIPKEVETPFSGNEEAFEGYTLSLPEEEWGTLHPFKIQLVFNSQGGSDLVLIEGTSKPFILNSWEERVKFEYISGNNDGSYIWPPLAKDHDQMPGAIAIRGVYGEQQLKLVVPYGGQKSQPPSQQNSTEKLFGVSLQ